MKNSHLYLISQVIGAAVIIAGMAQGSTDRIIVGCALYIVGGISAAIYGSRNK